MKAATGATATITIDPATQSLNDVIAAINAQTGSSGITASLSTTPMAGPTSFISIPRWANPTWLRLGYLKFPRGNETPRRPRHHQPRKHPPDARHRSRCQNERRELQRRTPCGRRHSFTVNGATINYDASIDSLNDVINRINSSSAGVTASYDSIADRITLSQSKQGSIALSLADDGTGGDFLAKTGLLSATQTLGTNAEYSINGGATQYATSNTVSLSTGVTLTLNALTNGTPATVTVSQDTNSALSAMQNFVTDFNSLYRP